MNTKSLTSLSWSTTSFGDAAHTSPMELTALGDHLALCRRSSGRLFGLRCSADVLHGFVTARFVTTLLLTAALSFGLALLVT